MERPAIPPHFNESPQITSTPISLAERFALLMDLPKPLIDPHLACFLGEPISTGDHMTIVVNIALLAFDNEA